MRRALDALYLGSGVLAGFFLVAIALLSLMQIGGRLLGFAAHSYDEFAGWCMAASSFLGLAYTLRASEHIRMTLLLHHVRPRGRRILEIACLAGALALSAFFAYWACDMTRFSWTTGDVSQGLVPVPLWIPQSAMAAGLAILVVALADDLAAALRGATLSYDRAEAAKAGAGFER
jgi:TRAP-type C4-dicarboxylate transport system permease small subunit